MNLLILRNLKMMVQDSRHTGCVIELRRKIFPFLETPDESVLFAIDPDVTARLGMWAPFLFEDANGDDQYNDGETIGGFSIVGWSIQLRR